MVADMEEEAVLETLPPEEHDGVWVETEQKFWSQFHQDQETWRSAHDQKYHVASTDLRVELSSLTGQRNALNESRARLERELLKVEDDLRAVGARCETKSSELAALDEEHRQQLAAQVAHWEKMSRTMTNFFREKRGQPPLPESEPVATNGTHSRPEPMEGVERAANGDLTRTGSSDEQDKLVDVVDADGQYIGPVKRVEPWNQWMEAIMKLPIQRPVQIRRGRRFNQEHLASIYEWTEAKGVKWLSCMIQAIGKVQSKRCLSCDKNQGAFENCIIVGGDLLQKCGNCEWNRQGCHGASGETIDLEAAERAVRERHEVEQREQERWDRERREREQHEREQLERQRLERERHEREQADRAHWPGQHIERHHGAHGYGAGDEKPEGWRRQDERFVRETREQDVLANQATAGPAAVSGWKAVRDDHAGAAEKAIEQLRRQRASAEENNALMGAAVPPENHARSPVQMPTPQEPREFPRTSGFTPANQRSRPPSRDMHTPVPASAEHSPQPRDEKPEVPLAEITRDNLVLRHNGNWYTHPECMAGVPVAKIHPGHPYWEPDWKDVRAEVVDARERWRQKHQAAIDAEARQEKTGSSKYQIGRQVNRGTKILEFLDDENQISPYQLLAKKYMHSSKGGITSYDTLFRLCETLSELSKFNLDITPVDWMRHRLHEIMVEKEEQGQRNFNLPKTVHDFYHDPKLTALRHKHGFKNIGRPSGQNKPGGRQSTGSVNGGTPKPTKKRKSAASYAGTPKEHSYVESPLGSQMVIHDEGPFLAARSQLAKRPKQEMDHVPPNGVDVDDYSDRDSVVEESLRRDDFRLLRIQSRLHASSPQDTQYWRWVPDQRKFEHRVLKGSNPPEWTSLKDPFDFGLRLDEVAEIRYDLPTNRVYIHVPPERDSAAPVVAWRRRGDLMADFKRGRTLKRFLSFCEAMRVPLVELPAGSLSRWEEFQSDQRPEPRAEEAAK